MVDATSKRAFTKIIKTQQLIVPKKSTKRVQNQYIQVKIYYLFLISKKIIIFFYCFFLK